MPGQPTTQKDRELITARLFRREPVPDIARSTGISKKTIWRISYNLKTFGTAVAPREDKPRGRPPLLTKEEHEVFVSATALLYSLLTSASGLGPVHARQSYSSSRGYGGLHSGAVWQGG